MSVRLGGASWAAAATLTVGLGGPPTYDFASIQEAIDAAASGDTVQVAAGTYYESVSWSSKTIRLVGDAEGGSVIDGAGTSAAYGIAVTGVNGALIEYMAVVGTDRGLVMSNCANAIVRHCDFSGLPVTAQASAYINSVGLTFEDNKALGCGGRPFDLRGTGTFIVQRNDCTDSPSSMYLEGEMAATVQDNVCNGAGITLALGATGHALVHHNYCESTAGEGLRIMGGTAASTVTDNSFRNSGTGLALHGTANQSDFFKQSNLNNNEFDGCGTALRLWYPMGDQPLTFSNMDFSVFQGIGMALRLDGGHNVTFERVVVSGTDRAMPLSGSDILLLNCTLTENGRGVEPPEGTTIRNCIIWGNDDDISPAPSTVSVTYSDIGERPSGLVWPGGGNISADPLFVDASAGDFHLLPGSPCIGTGDPNDAVPPGGGARIDMGAFESPANRPPQIVAITGAEHPVDLAADLSVTATFTDPDSSDTHTATWDWGDDSASDVVIPSGDRSTSAGHTYGGPGVYTLTLTIKDNWDASDMLQYRYAVVYDPDGGFVTGGGWIWSAAGAYAADELLEGKANFGFNSKYNKGAEVPTGQTEFQFKVADLNFHSSAYQWMVVAGPHAKCKGDGTINGAGSYGFMLTTTDCAINGGGEADKFRIKIWDKDDGDAVVYDNQMGASDDANAGTELGGGNIVIHEGGDQVASQSADLSGATAMSTSMGAQVVFTLTADADVSATVRNIAGRPVRRLCSAKPCDAGSNTLLWNAQADNGLRVPNGVYLVEIEARGANGSRSRALTQLRLDR